MALSDFWQLKDNQVFDGKKLLTIYQVKRIDVGATAALIAQAYLDHILDGFLDAIQPIGLTRTTVEVENLFTVTDFSSVDSSAFPGLVVGHELPGFNVGAIQYNRTRTDMKNGQKRYTAGTENEQLNGEWNAGFLTLLDTLATQTMTPWEGNADPGVDLCEFVILKRFCVDPVEDPCTVYRLPNTDTEVDDNHYVPVNALSRTRVRSQVSRKVLA